MAGGELRGRGRQLTQPLLLEAHLSLLNQGIHRLTADFIGQRLDFIFAQVAVARSYPCMESVHPLPDRSSLLCYLQLLALFTNTGRAIVTLSDRRRSGLPVLDMGVSVR